MKRIVPALFLVLANLSTVWADVPVSPPPSKSVPIRIEVDNQGARTRLVIPRHLLFDLETAALEVVPDHDKTRFARLANPALGLSLTAALCLAGFCVVRKPRPALRNGLALLVLFPLVPGILGIAMATPWLRPTKEQQDQWTNAWIRGEKPTPNFELTGPVDVEVVERGEVVRLILCKKSVSQLRYERK